MAEATLEEMAQALARGRERLAAAEARVEEAKGPYHAAVADAESVRTAVELIEDGMENARRAYMIGRAVEDAGLTELVGEAPSVIATNRYRGIDRWELTAVGPEGTPLYVFVSSLRSASKQFARPPRPGDADLLAAYESEEAKAERLRQRKVRGYASDQDRERLPRPVSTRDEKLNLVYWQERGRGDFGDGSGALKPQPPPEGGRWRWLKVREQELLAQANEEGSDG